MKQQKRQMGREQRVSGPNGMARESLAEKAIWK